MEYIQKDKEKALDKESSWIKMLFMFFLPAARERCVPPSPFIPPCHLNPTWHVWAESQTPPQWIYYSATHKGHFCPPASCHL